VSSVKKSGAVVGMSVKPSRLRKSCPVICVTRSRAKRDSRYHSGRSRDWIKIKNMAHPAIERAMLIALSKR
jgi:hypothetical protein